MNGEFRRDSTQGEFRGDFTRDTFTPEEHFIRVLSQQGRVWLDADWNEQTSILLHYIQTLAKDIIGDHGGWDEGFLIESEIDGEKVCPDDFQIHEGHYYVDGILCENDRPICYSGQKDYPLEEPLSTLLSSNTTSSFLVYLDVWERHVSYIQDMDNKYKSIREVALGGPDTATRSKLIWQVKVKPLGVPPLDLDDFDPALCVEVNCCQEIEGRWKDILLRLQPKNRGWLVAKAKFVDEPKSPCSISPEAKFTGEGNYLYRVEIHNGGNALNAGKGDAEKTSATFKWSRSNGSVEFPLSVSVGAPTVKDGKESTLVTLEHLRCCDSPCLSEDDWVEIVDDDYVLLNKNEPLWQVKSIDSLKWEVTLERDTWEKSHSSVGSDLTKHPLLRRWDQKERELKKDDPYNVGPLSEGTVVLVESEVESDSGDKKAIWIQLEKGIKVMFLKNDGNDDGRANEYRTGDYWLIPARAAIGDIEWPKYVENKIIKPCALEPHGINHHYAPLAIISFASNNRSMADANISPCRSVCDRTCRPELPSIKESKK